MMHTELKGLSLLKNLTTALARIEGIVSFGRSLWSSRRRVQGIHEGWVAPMGVAMEAGR